MAFSALRTSLLLLIIFLGSKALYSEEQDFIPSISFSAQMLVAVSALQNREDEQLIHSYKRHN